MAEPLARMETGSEGVLADAAQRLERALQALEVVVARPRPAGAAPATASTQVVELASARRRARELETAAADASQALGRAIAEVRQALNEDEADAGDRQTSLFDSGLLDSPLEPGRVLPDEEAAEADESASEKEPTA